MIKTSQEEGCQFRNLVGTDSQVDEARTTEGQLQKVVQVGLMVIDGEIRRPRIQWAP